MNYRDIDPEDMSPEELAAANEWMKHENLRLEALEEEKRLHLNDLWAQNAILDAELVVMNEQVAILESMENDR